MKTKLFLFGILLTLFCACKTKTIDDKYNSTTYDDDMKSFSASKAFSNDEQKLLASYINSRNGDTSALSKSYKTLLEEAKALEKQKQDYEAKQKQLNEQLIIYLKNKKTETVYRDGVWNNEVILTANFKNNSRRTINGFTFNLSFLNANNEPIANQTWTLDNTLKENAAKTISFSAGIVDNNNEASVKIKIADLSKIKTKYQVTQLLFNDGTSISLN